MARSIGVVCRAALVVATVAVAACSSGDGGGGSVDVAKDPKAALAATSQRTTAARTVSLSLSASTRTNKNVLTGSGKYDFPAKLGRFTLKTPGTTSEIVLTEEAIYVKNPKKVAGQKTWILLRNGIEGAASYLASLRQQVDPRTTLDALGASVVDLKSIGTDKVRDAKTTHLKGRVDLTDTAIAAAPADQQQGLRNARDALHVQTYPIDIWLDGDGRLRRVSYAITTTATGTSNTTTVTLELFGFGEKNTIKVPPDNDVRDGAGLLNATTTTAAG
jgi:hypothetical protein